MGRITNIAAAAAGIALVVSGCTGEAPDASGTTTVVVPPPESTTSSAGDGKSTSTTTSESTASESTAPGSGTSSPSSARSTHTVTQTVTSSSGVTSSPGTGPTDASPTGDTPPTADARPCPSSALAVGGGDHHGAAGTVAATLTLTNRSATTCTLRGYPGVSFVGTDGRQVGQPADRSGDRGELVRLEPGRTASFDVTWPTDFRTRFPDCRPAGAAGYRVYPPDTREALRLTATGLQVCSGPTPMARVHPLRGDG